MKNKSNKKNPHAVAMGKIGGKTTMSKLTKAERKAFSAKGHEARWGKKKDQDLTKS